MVLFLFFVVSLHHLDITQRCERHVWSQTSLVSLRTSCLSLDIPVKRGSSSVWSRNNSAAACFPRLKPVCHLFTCAFPQAVSNGCAPLSGIRFFSHCFGTYSEMRKRTVVILSLRCIYTHSNFSPPFCRRSRRQDIMHGNPLTQCRGFNLKGN